jgi:hypothetical protein
VHVGGTSLSASNKKTSLSGCSTMQNAEMKEIKIKVATVKHRLQLPVGRLLLALAYSTTSLLLLQMPRQAVFADC